jgi:hypothetical protein
VPITSSLSTEISRIEQGLALELVPRSKHQRSAGGSTTPSAAKMSISAEKNQLATLAAAEAGDQRQDDANENGRTRQDDVQIRLRTVRIRALRDCSPATAG